MSLFLFNLKIALRALKKYPAQTLISIFALSAGIIIFVLSAFWIKYETGYDSFHKDADKVIVASRLSADSESGIVFHLSGLVKDYVITKFPYVENAALYNRWGLYYNDNSKYEKGLLIDRSFPDILNFEVLRGDLNDIFGNRNNIFVTDRMAKENFGDEDPMGKTITSGNTTFTICGIVKDWGEQTAFPFGILGEIDMNERYDCAAWNKQDVSVIMKIKDGIKAKDYYYAKHDIEEDGNTLYNVPLRDMNIIKRGYKNVKYGYIKLFSLMGIVLILCAIINYLILFLSRLKNRMPDVLLLKVNGANNSSVFSLFFMEIIIILLISVFLSLIGMEILVDWFKDVAVINEASGNIFRMIMIYSLLLLFSISLIISVPLLIYKNIYYKEYISGKLSGFSALRNMKLSFNSGAFIFQVFFSSIFLFITIVFLLQMNHMLNGDLGYDRKNVCTMINWSDIDENKIREILREADKSDYISDITFTSEPYLPSTGITRAEFQYNDIIINADLVNVKSNYFEMMKNKGAATFGEFPNIEKLDELYRLTPSDENCIVINETAANRLGITDLSEDLNSNYARYPNTRSRIVGVIQDIYHSPFSDVNPTIYIIRELNNLRSFPMIVFKYTDGNKKNAEALLEEISGSNDNYTGFYDMENEYREYFRSEILLTKIILSGTLISLLICGFGIYSILMLSCERRRKEIAIRKVNGAGRFEIIRLFISSYLIMSIIALICALPIGYILSEQWLSTYKVRIDQGFYIYLMTAFIVVGLIIVVCYDKLRRISGVSPARELRKG